jgi:Fe-S-cluster-containing hydrogenase component 2
VAGTIALIDYRKCDPGRCFGGRCIAIEVCPRGLLYQEEPYEEPMLNAAGCRGCGDCVLACPAGAIILASG